jgi:DNA-binding transcriptional LysR family regulator
VLYAPDLDTSLLWVTAKRGIIAASDQCIAADNPAFRFVPLKQLGNTIFSFIWDKQNNNPSLEVFLAFLSDYVAKNPLPAS